MKTKFLHPVDICETLGLTKRALMDLIRRNELPAFQFGRDVRVRADHFNTFVEKARIKK